MTTIAARPTTLADYGRRLERVLAYLGENLNDEVDLERLASIACFSPYHFHRVYRAVQGETVAETVRRMRLHRAALDLIAAELPIERIAARAGYGSQAAFTRAFRSAYGAPPGAYRASVSTAGPYPVELRATAPLRVAALRHEGDFNGIGPTFDRLMAHSSSRGLVGPTTRYFGIFYQDPACTPVDALRSDACLTVPLDFRGDAPLELREIPGGRSAVLRHVGPYAALHQAYEWLYGEWLLGSGEEPRDAPCVEEYLNDPRDTPPAELVTEIALPLSERT